MQISSSYDNIAEPFDSEPRFLDIDAKSRFNFLEKKRICYYPMPKLMR